MEQTMCIYNRHLHHTYNEKEIKFNIKDVTMIDPVTEWFKITYIQDQKKLHMIKNRSLLVRHS